MSQKDANSLLDSSDLQQMSRPQLQEPDVCPALHGRLMCLWQGRQGAQHAQCLSQHWSQSCTVGKSQRGKQIGTNKPECDMGELRYGHIFCWPLTSSVLDSCLHYLLDSNSPDKNAGEKGSGKETVAITNNSELQTWLLVCFFCFYFPIKDMGSRSISVSFCIERIYN